MKIGNFWKSKLSCRGDATYLSSLLTPPFVRWRLEIIAKIRHWDRNILSGPERDGCCYLYTAASYTQPTIHKGKGVKATFR